MPVTTRRSTARRPGVGAVPAEEDTSYHFVPRPQFGPQPPRPPPPSQTRIKTEEGEPQIREVGGLHHESTERQPLLRVRGGAGDVPAEGGSTSSSAASAGHPVSPGTHPARPPPPPPPPRPAAPGPSTATRQQAAAAQHPPPEGREQLVERAAATPLATAAATAGEVQEERGEHPPPYPAPPEEEEGATAVTMTTTPRARHSAAAAAAAADAGGLTSQAVSTATARSDRLCSLAVRCPSPPPPPSFEGFDQYTQPGGGGGTRRRRGGKRSDAAAAQQQQPRYPPPTQHRHLHTGPVVRILIVHGMSESELGRCVAQATDSEERPFGTTWDDDGRGGSLVIVGLFRERDRVFLPLSHILADPTSHERDVFSLIRPASRAVRVAEKVEETNWSLVLLAGSVVAAVVWMFLSPYFGMEPLDVDGAIDSTHRFVESGIISIVDLPRRVFDLLVDVPLRELYRHGPAFVGWEGAPLPHICARITYHGDEEFWTRNLAECEGIYEAKERAAMHVRRPVLYVAAGYLAFLAIRSLVRTWALRGRYRPDRNMVDTYQAFNMLVRQFQRAGGARK